MGAGWCGVGVSRPQDFAYLGSVGRLLVLSAEDLVVVRALVHGAVVVGADAQRSDVIRKPDPVLAP